jgi:hypothetical protein
MRITYIEYLFIKCVLLNIQRFKFIMGATGKIYVNGICLFSPHTRIVCDLFNAGSIMWIDIVATFVCTRMWVGERISMKRAEI